LKLVFVGMSLAIHPTIGADMVAEAVGGDILVNGNCVAFLSFFGHDFLETLLGCLGLVKPGLVIGECLQIFSRGVHNAQCLGASRDVITAAGSGDGHPADGGAGPCE
jgi:hypothetical protein